MLSCSQFVIEKDGQEKQLSFVDILLERCQNEFKRDMYSNINIESLISHIESASDNKQRTLLINELDMKKWRAKIRFLGIVKFVGELYLQEILSDKLMICFIEALTNRCDEEAIESLCTLLKKVAPKLESGTTKCQRQSTENNILLPIYRTLHAFENSQQISCRLRFMIGDIFEMRSNGWIARKAFEEINPKTISEIHLDSTTD
ncbi:hypothetical protein B4U80_11717 [Leptotrombidium deliense]|uniref:MIF4G domain-containing protein n=1 Tax=Leptotrombidium deliense TaxID=299467 RepID=A0A443S3J5_9ACAR|nr:hypothetical protein B4U80_11717 [Leptotrombidium deliense]